MNNSKFRRPGFFTLLLFLFILAWATPAARAFTALLQGQSFGSSVWQANNLTNWLELDLIPCRVLFTGGPTTNQTIVVEFDHTKTSGSTITPGLQNLFNFTNSTNVVITSGPTLSAPAGVDTWSYTFVINFNSATNEGFVEFRTRMAAGAHNFTGSSLQLKGTPSLGTLQISKPGPAPGNPDLVLTKSGPTNANPGQTITYVLTYTNRASGGVATGVQLTDILPGMVTFVSCSGGCSSLGNTITWDLGDLSRGASGMITYQVIVTNNAINGQTFKNSALLALAQNDVNPSDNSASVTTTITLGCIPPTIVQSPSSSTNCAGTPASFSLIANGSTLAYQWRRNGTNIAGATASSYSIASVSSQDTTSYDVVITNLCGVTNSSVATLALIESTTADPLLSLSNCLGDTVSFTTTAHGAGSFAYQWVKDGSPLDSQTNSSLTISNIAMPDAGTYSVQVSGACNSATNFATLVVKVPTTADPLVSQTNCPGDTVSFSTVAHGTGPFSFQWVKGGTPLSGQTDSSLTLPNITAASADTYLVRVTGACTSVTNFATLTVNVPTTADPLVSQTNCPGDTVSFSTAAHGTGPFSFQWVKGGTPLSGQTDSSLTLPNITAASADSYSVRVTGACTSVTNFATLTVNVPTTADPLVSQTNCPGGTVSFSTAAHGTGPFSFQWVKGGTPLSGQTDSSLTLPNITAASADTYSVRVTGACTSVTNFATLTVNVPTTADPLVSQTNCPGGTVSFSTAAHGTGPFSFQWVKGGTPLSGQTDSSLTLPNITATSADTYSVRVTGACTSVTNFATLTVNVPTTADPLVSQTNCPGGTVSFSTAAHGTGPFSFQWVKGGTPISGQTDSSLALSNITATSADTYSVRVTGACTSVTNFATLTVNVPTTADPLVSQTNCPGGTVSFSTAAHGTGPFSFQWVKGGTPISGQTDSSLALSNITATSADTYSVRVTGTCNSATNFATLTINVPTSADPFVSQTNCSGATLSFSTVAHGTGPFSYLWRKDGKTLPGATSSSLVLSNTTVLDAGSYNVIVTGVCNAVTNSATLTVPAPTTAMPMANRTNCFGQSVTFGTTASGAGPFSYVWKQNGNLLAGQTSNSITIGSIKAADGGTYVVEVTGLCNSVTNSATLIVRSDGLTSPATFANTNAITIQDFSPANPYPSTIDVSCVPKPVTQLIVSITNLNHTYAADIDILLVSPTGQAIMLMSDAGGASAITNAIIGFSDAAANFLPDTAAIVTGVYKPTNYGTTDNMPGPAPLGPYPTSLSAFNGSDPNGTWSLYVVDDAQVDAGSVTGGWSLTLAWEVSVPPPWLSSPTILSDGRFRTTLNGLSGVTYVIETSVDLNSWTPAHTNTLSGTTTDFMDGSITNSSRRFYRAVYHP